eukprot:gene10720-10876_t
MDRFRDFTFDRDRYPEQHLRDFVESLHAAGRRWVPIIDAGIPVAKDDEAYQSGLAAGVFVRDKNGDPYIGQEHIQRMYDKVPFDGLWIDMNEPSNFCSGERLCYSPIAVGRP